MSKRLKYYAVCRGEWLELRSHTSQPKAKVSEAPYKAKVYDLCARRYKHKSIIMKCVTFVGGNRVKVLKTRSFRALTKIRIKKHEVIEIKPEVFSSLIGTQGRDVK